MRQLCFLSNLTSAEWAAWFQGIGSVAAVFVAVWIAKHQHGNMLKRDAAAREREERTVARLCVTAGVQVLECMANFVQACQLQNAEMQSRSLYHLREVIDFARAIKIEQIPADAVWPFMTVRTIAAAALRDAEFLDNNPSKNYLHWAQRFDSLRRDASKASMMLSAALGDEIAKEARDELVAAQAG